MMLTVYCVRRDRSEITFSLQVSAELELRDFVALCELESEIPAAEIQITHAEQPLGDLARTLGSYGLKDGDVVVLRQAERRPPVQPAFPGLPRIDFSSIAVPGTSSTRQLPAQQLRSPPPPAPPSLHPGASPQGLDDPALLRDMLLANPHELSLLKERNPPLAEALLSGDLERFTKVLLEQQQERARREQERIRLLTADPFDLEAQAKIEEDIRQHNIEENMTIAMEEAPESFGQVVMLYINCKVNGHPVKAFVDSGAQMTIMSQACAERCNIMRLVDRRWAGIAKGVGTQKIIGRVHLAQVQIEGDFLPCSFSILEDQPMDMLLGLDMLKRHQCSIDLKKNVLLIGTTGSETRFLPEAELPECARLAYGAGREEVQPQEIADRELAEALQRSVQESDTEDGRTTSPKPPLYPAPAASCPPHGQTLDQSVSTPDLLIPLQPAQRLSPSTAERSQSEPQFQGLPAPTAGLPADPPVTAVGQDASGEPIHTPSPPALQLGTPAALEVIPGWDAGTGSINLEESLSSFSDKSPQTSEEISLADGELVPNLQPSRRVTREPVDLESLQTGSVPATSVTLDPQCQSKIQHKEDVLSERQSEVGTSEDMVGKLRLLSQNLGSRSFSEKPDLKSGGPSNILEVGLRKDFGGTQGESMALEGLSDCKTQSDSLDMDLQGSRGPDLPEESLDMELQALSGPDTQRESLGMEPQALSGPDTQQESVGMELQALSGPDTRRESVGMEPQALSGPDTRRESVGMELQGLSGPDTQQESVGMELQAFSGPDTQQESVGMEPQAFSGPDTQQENVGMELQGLSGPDTQQESVGMELQAFSGPDTQSESVGMELQGSSGPGPQEDSMGMELEVADVKLESNNRPTEDPELISSQVCLSPPVLGIARPEDLTHENYDETSVGKMQELCGESPPDPSMVSLCPPPLAKNQPQGEKQGADNTHSLAAALLELHELLVASSRGTSQDLTPGDSPVCQRQDADSSDVPVSWGQTCMQGGFLVNTETEASIAKPETAAAECPSPSPSPNLLSVKEQDDRAQPAWVPEIEQGSSEMQTGQGSSGGESDVLEEKQLVSKAQECRVPGSGQLGRGVASRRASVPDALDSEMEVPLNSSAGPLVSGVPDGQSFPQVLFPSSGGAPLVSPAPQGVAATRPLHFPDAHIQRITSAGFTDTEAVETLEQFQGNPELALLVLLARKIKVPT
nr:PREDICTED: uncharacterized protein LOC102687523 isoform X1 [Lepisosteus oculatus]